MKKSKSKTEVTMEIHKSYGALNDDDSKVFALVSWNGAEPKYDIRKQYVSKGDGKIHYSTGIGLTEQEMDILVEKYTEAKKNKKKNQGVDFDKIFESAHDINEMRKHGYVTENGHVVIKKKK